MSSFPDGLELYGYRAYCYKDFKADIASIHKTKGRKKVYEYYNMPCSFDIETSKKDDFGWVYQWQFAIFGRVYFGRTLEQYMDFVNTLKSELNLSADLRLIVYVHNLSYEFQWIRKYFDWQEVFAVESRKVLTCLDANGIYYKCSYMLTHKKLETIGQDLGMAKLVGHIDYSEIYAPWTPLDRDHILYGIADVAIVCEKIKKELERFKTLADIPLTMTGYVRRELRNRCIKTDNKAHNREYQKFMKQLTLDLDEYNMLNRHVFAGGKVMASHQHSGKVLHSVASYDITSSYPAVLARYYPMGKGMYKGMVGQSEWNELKEKYCIMARMSFVNIREKTGNYGYISETKCTRLKDKVVANGIIYSASELVTYGTELDLDIINAVYDYDDIYIDMAWIYKKGKLPNCIIKYMLDVFQIKSQLKGVAGKEDEYMLAKNNFNSIYGMMVTAVVRERISYLNDEWIVSFDDDKGEGQLYDYDNSWNKFLSYPWGVWVTAHARWSLFYMIQQLGDDFVYCDTDSIKLLNVDKHKEKFDSYNKNMVEFWKNEMKRLKIEKPLYIAGKSVLGTWTFEGVANTFKALGSKRYIYSDIDGNHATVAGLSKTQGRDYIFSQENPFEFFKTDMVVPKKHTGRLIFKYVDGETENDIIDLYGDPGHIITKSAIILEESEYHLGISSPYRNFLEWVQYRE